MMMSGPTVWTDSRISPCATGTFFLTCALPFAAARLAALMTFFVRAFACREMRATSADIELTSKVSTVG